jgi:hypothetical protein
MAQAGLKTETIAGPEARIAKQTGVNWLNFEVPNATSDLCHDLFEETCITLARGASEYSTKMVDAINTNANNIFEFAGQLANARSWPEVVAAYTSQGRKQFDVFSTQAQELSALAQKVAIDALAPITLSFPNILKTTAASS